MPFLLLLSAPEYLISHRLTSCVTSHTNTSYYFTCHKSRDMALYQITPIPSHPMYCQVNILELEDERLRDSLFFHIFKKALIFDDFGSATAYRQSVVQRGQQPPMLYSVCGRRIGSDGILDPTRNRCYKPAYLRNVFGMQPWDKTREHIKLVAGT